MGYAGKGSVRADGKGQLIGERLAGANHQVLGAPVDCVLDEVASVKGTSAISSGQCTFSGDGRIDATLQALYTFTEAGVLLPVNATTASLFKGLNAAVYTKNGTYEVFTISQINETHVSGLTYFSTRLQTWETDFSTGEKLVEECSLFVDGFSSGDQACTDPYNKNYPYPKGGTQYQTCGRNAYCCAGGSQASRSGCAQGALSAEKTALKLGRIIGRIVDASSIRACCHKSDSDNRLHVTVATMDKRQAKYHPNCKN